MVNEAIDHTTPLDILIENEQMDISFDDRDLFIAFLIETLHFILDQNTDKKELVIYSILYALEDFTANELSERDRSVSLGVSHYLITHYKKKYKQTMNL